MWDGKRVDGCGDRQTDWRRRSQAFLVEQNPAAVTMTDTQFERGGEEGRLWNCRGREVRVVREGQQNFPRAGEAGAATNNTDIKYSFVYFQISASTIQTVYPVLELT